MKILGRLCLAAVGLAAMSLSWAQDVHNLSEDHPTSVEDAYPTPAGEQQFLLFFAFASDNDFDVITLEPGFQLGLAQDWHARISVPFFFTDGDDVTGDLRLQFLWGNKGQNDPETAIALAGEVDFPTGDFSDDELDTRLRLIVTHPLDPGNSQSRLHFNVAWLQSDGDDLGTAFLLGWSNLMDVNTAFVADIVHFDPEFGDPSDMLELGLRKQMNRDSVGSLGLRFGLDDDAADFAITLSWQARIK